MTNKKKIICKYKFHDDYHFNGKPYCTCFNELCEDISIICDHNCQIYEDFKQLARKTQECEELKRKVELMMDCPDCKVDEYKKALEEIEEVWEKDEDGDYDFVRWQILDIINKAKGEGDE